MREPRTRLQAARFTAGWSQPRLIVAMRHVGRQLRMGLPSGDESLKTQLTRWENGRTMPNDDYRRLFRAVYGLTDRELGFPVAEMRIPLGASQPSREAMDYFAVLLAEHLRADNLMGQRHVIDIVRHQAQHLAHMARASRGPQRRPVLTMAFRYNEFLGWLCQDAGLLAEAMTVTDRARDLVTEVRDPLWSAYVLMRKSNIATEDGDSAGAAAMIDHALETSGALPPRLHATLLRQQANAHARLRNSHTCAAAIDQALTVVGTDDPEGALLAGYCNEPYVAMEAADCWMRLGRPARALETYRMVTTAWPEALRRDRGLSLARLASVQATVGAVREACTSGAEAVAVARTTSSVRTLKELRRLQDALAPWSRDETAGALRGSIASVVASAA